MRLRYVQTAVLLIFIFQFQLIFCISRKPASIEMVHDNKILYNCRSAEIIKLENSGHSGFMFHCGRSSASLIYDTNVRKDGTVKRIELDSLDSTGRITERNTFEPAVKVNVRGGPKCSSAAALNRITGEPPLPEDFWGNIIMGTYRFEMSEPCGTLFITLK